MTCSADDGRGENNYYTHTRNRLPTKGCCVNEHFDPPCVEVFYNECFERSSHMSLYVSCSHLCPVVNGVKVADTFPADVIPREKTQDPIWHVFLVRRR